MSTTSNSATLTVEDTAGYRQRVEEAAQVLQAHIPSTPAVAVLTESELSGLTGDLTVNTTLSFTDIPHFPVSDGTLRIGAIEETTVVLVDQQLHLYKGHTPRQVAFPVRMLALAGIDTLILSARAESVNVQFNPGDLMLVIDHINFQGMNPLVGPNVDEWGPRFPDMTEPYNPALRQETEAVARAEALSLRKGVYLATLGPSVETTAEQRMARRLGADAVGTSMVPEVIAARHMDVRVLAVALLTAQARGEGSGVGTSGLKQELDHGRQQLQGLVTAILSRVSTGVATA